MNKLTIGYFADGPWSHAALDRLIKEEYIEFKFIVPRADTKDQALHDYAKVYGLDYLKTQNINSSEFIEKLKKYKCDLFISMSFNQIFKQEIINLPILKTINVHAGKLPFYRGRNVLNWVLINGEKEFGVTVHYVDEGIDTGDIIFQNIYEISENDDYNSILKRAYEYCADCLEKAVMQTYSGQVKRIKQSTIHPTGFYCGGREMGDELINWDLPSAKIFSFVRALNQPAGPGAKSYINGEEVIINKVKINENAPFFEGIPGQVIGKEEDSLFVKTKDSWISLVNYVSKRRIRIGDRLSRNE